MFLSDLPERLKRHISHLNSTPIRLFPMCPSVRTCECVRTNQTNDCQESKNRNSSGECKMNDFLRRENTL